MSTGNRSGRFLLVGIYVWMLVFFLVPFLIVAKDLAVDQRHGATALCPGGWRV